MQNNRQKGKDIKMEHQGISYRLTIKEFVYLLFTKKICPKCGNILQKEKKYKIKLGKEISDSKRCIFFGKNIKVKSYYYEFICPSCNTSYSIGDLSKR